MYNIPTSVTVNGKEYAIRNNGDYRVILDCFLALGDAELDVKEKLLSALIIFYNAFNSVEDINEVDDIEDFVTEMYNFFNCGSMSMGTKNSSKLVDWELDEQLIASAINKVCGFEIRSAPYVHWWTFMGYYTAIGECPLSTIIHIRDKITKGEKLEKHERKFRQDNPQYFAWNTRSVEQTEADKLVRELWNNGE